MSVLVDFGTNCRWCGHELHDEACTRTIQTGGSKTPITKPCPCIKHERRTKEPK
jgi:hypothetical protein